MPIPPDTGADTRVERAPDRDYGDGQETSGPVSGGYDRPAGAGSGSWYGSTTDGAAGKGPVRGYPPVPGQPPPMYPPGQFSAWNRPRPGQERSGQGQPGQGAPGEGPAGQGQPGQGRRGQGLGSEGRRGLGQPGQELAGQGRAGPGRPGPAGARSGGGRPGGREPVVRPGWQAPGDARPGGQPGGAGGAAGAGLGPGGADRPVAGSGYYERGSETDPGYSMLAVSDPAADVTSTQTWQAIGDGRATGVWTKPDRPGPALPEVTPVPVSGPRADSARAPAGAGPGARHRSSQAEPAGDGQAADGQAAAGPAAPLVPRQGRRAQDATATPQAVTPQPATAARATRSARRPSRRKRSGSLRLAVAGAVVLVLVAAAALAYAVLRSSPKPHTAAPPVTKPTTAAPSPSPSLGPYGDIGSRKSDPVPLAIAQLYPESYTSGAATVELTASKLGRSCTAAISGSGLQSVVSSAHCTQVARATYLSSGQGLMGTIGVFNLGTAAGATKAVKAADAGDFVLQLKAKHGKTAKIGQGTGIEEAAAKGHYLILIWAEFTSLRKPKSGAQRTEIENFMTVLLDKTANVSLANRMVSGAP